jgi:hypothetical protein
MLESRAFSVPRGPLGLATDPCGAVAQLGERRVRNAKVEGSIPFRSTIYLSWAVSGSTTTVPKYRILLKTTDHQLLGCSFGGLAHRGKDGG